MNTMNYEKAYKEALERAKGAHNSAKSDKENGVTDKITEYTIQLTETIFPELKESEDEKIKKEIISHFKETIKNIRNEEITPHSGKVLIAKMQKWIAWLEKQGEHKHAWSEEDELMIQDAIHWINEFQKSNKCKDENDMQNSVTCENWLKSLKDRVQPQPKQEWSEEDEKRLQSCLNVLQPRGIMEVTETVNTKWLKSLKDRVQPQPKQEWSEEDEKMLGKAISTIRYALSIPLDSENDSCFADSSTISWLKSLKERYTWKPSESDILLLERIANGKSNPQDFQASLHSLIGQLNKLKEE